MHPYFDRAEKVIKIEKRAMSGFDFLGCAV